MPSKVFRSLICAIKKRPIKFAALKLLFIFLNIALNLFYYVILEGNDVGYAFLFNLVCTSVVMVCMIPELRGFTYVLDKELLKRMLRYSLPLVILGVAGILNQVADKIIFLSFIPMRRKLPYNSAFTELPIRLP